MDEGARSELARWHVRRREMLDTAGFGILVGHEDLLAHPADR